MEREVCAYEVFMKKEVCAYEIFEDNDELSQDIESKVNEFLAESSHEKLYRAVLNQCGDDTISAMSELYNIYSSSCGMAGCYAGMVYYSETNAFFDSYQDEISELILEFDDSVGDNYMASKFGKDYLESGEQVAKNTATWFAFEEAAHTMMEQIELDLDKIEFISEEKQAIKHKK